jgi:16S rRNA (guanine966-N2)-methyltransferase
MSKQAGVRIVAGRWRGLRVRTRAGADVRPTADRVKEALFSILEPRLRDATVVDCFAGTGSLGIEALSRGAVRAVFVENDRRTLAVLQDNLQRLTEEETHAVLPLDALDPKRWGAAVLPADVILADPPYRRGLAQTFLTALADVQALRPGGVLVVEHETGTETEHPAWEAIDRRRYGDTTLSFFAREGEP